MKAIKIDFKGRFYKNCKRQRKAKAKICQVCPFRDYIEEQENIEEKKNIEELKVALSRREADPDETWYLSGHRDESMPGGGARHPLDYD